VPRKNWMAAALAILESRILGRARFPVRRPTPSPDLPDIVG
jgi:hypothetical protein